MHKVYLGDAVYVEVSSSGLKLTTEDGMTATNTIYLEPQVWSALAEYVAELKKDTERTGQKLSEAIREFS